MWMEKVCYTNAKISDELIELSRFAFCVWFGDGDPSLDGRLSVDLLSGTQAHVPLRIVSTVVVRLNPGLCRSERQ